MPYWNSKTSLKNAYWDSLSGLHTFTLILAFIELFMKGGLIGIIFIEYRNKFGSDIRELFKFGYSAQSFPITLSKIYLYRK